MARHIVGKRTDDFFTEKRSWSFIKDEVLGSYMEPYMAKIVTRGQPILIIDGYAGPGIFQDGKLGSPMIICQAAEKCAKGKYQALFINKNKQQHHALTSLLSKKQLSPSAKSVLDDTTTRLPHIYDSLQNESVLLYLDPFGLTGCKFFLLQPFLTRNPQHSTEILLTMNMPGMHRLAAKDAVGKGQKNKQRIQSFHQTLTDVLGGEYWQEIMWQDGATSDQKDKKLIEAYRAKLAQYMPYVGSCPVREKTNRQIKYFIVFASRHPDTVKLLNDSMLKAYWSGLHTADYPNSLWGYEDLLNSVGLEEIIVETVKSNEGKTRDAIWLEIIKENFMKYLHKNYRAKVQRLVDEGRLCSPTPRKTKSLNDDCALYLPSEESASPIPML